MGVLDSLADLIAPLECINDLGVPTASIAISDEVTGEIQAHVIKKGPNAAEDADTIYQACSISKAITALGVARLVDEGKLSYDTRVMDFMPANIIDIMVEPRTRHLMKYVTVALLLSHRAGLSQHGFPGYTGVPPTVEQVFSGQYPTNSEKIRFISLPGSQWKYSGGGYMALQVVLETLSGVSFPELMQTLVFKPLDMTRSCFGAPSAEENNFARPYATAQVRGSEVGRGYHRFAALAAAGLWTTPTDLLKATVAIQRSLHEPNGFISMATARAMLTTVEPNSAMISMALGWSADENVFAHSGSNEPGYRTYVLAFHGGAVNNDRSSNPPRLNRGGLAIMTNSALGTPVLKKLTAAIFYLKGWPRIASLPCGMGSFAKLIPLPAPGGTHIFEEWQKWAGKWSNGWELCDNDGTPAITFEGCREPMRLRPAAAATELPAANEPQCECTLVVDGLEIAFNFITKDGERVLEVVQDEAQLLARV